MVCVYGDGYLSLPAKSHTTALNTRFLRTSLSRLLGFLRRYPVCARGERLRPFLRSDATTSRPWTAEWEGIGGEVG